MIEDRGDRVQRIEDRRQRIEYRRYNIYKKKKISGGAAGTAGGGGLPTNTLIQTLALSLALVPLGLSAVAVFPPFAT